VGGEFLQQAAQKQERFLAMGYKYSYKTLDWLAQQAAGRYSVHALGVYDGVKVLEFAPREPAAAGLPRRGMGLAGGVRR
jgi:hypothetical protein